MGAVMEPELGRKWKFPPQRPHGGLLTLQDAGSSFPPVSAFGATSPWSLPALVGSVTCPNL